MIICSHALDIWEQLYTLCRPDDDSERGRPRVTVDIEEVEFLHSLNFQWKKIANILGVSRSTLHRRLREEGMQDDLWFSDICDDDLDILVKQIKEEHCNDGEVLMAGHLAARNIRVQRTRLRASIHRVDPLGTVQRRMTTVVRRIYNVGNPNEVWHFDGHHKLIRWRLVTHGGVDGYSRLVVFLHCSTNNTASTVLSVFTEAVGKYGLPQRVRSDLGGENIDVWRFMIAQHGHDQAVITGSSTHNERIERLWRDVFRCVIKLFYDTFYSLEDEGILNPLNEVDIFCLHFVFVPRINKCLNEFTESWNHHKMSSVHNFTPYQMFLTGTISQSRAVAGDLTQVHIPPYLSVSEAVVVPRSTFQPCHVLKCHLASSINPFQPSDDFGAGLFRQCATLVGTHMRVCAECA